MTTFSLVCTEYGMYVDRDGKPLKMAEVVALLNELVNRPEPVVAPAKPVGNWMNTDQASARYLVHGTSMHGWKREADFPAGAFIEGGGRGSRRQSLWNIDIIDAWLASRVAARRQKREAQKGTRLRREEQWFSIGIAKAA